MGHLTRKVTLKKLINGLEASVDGDGWNQDVTLSAALVDGKPMLFLSTYVLDGQGGRLHMESTESFRTLKEVRELLA